MINFDVTQEDIKEYNSNWPQVPDHPYRFIYILKNHMKQNINV